MTISDGKNYKDCDFLEDEEIVMGISGKEIIELSNALSLYKNSCPFMSEERSICENIEQMLLDKNLEIAEGYYNKYVEEHK